MRSARFLVGVVCFAVMSGCGVPDQEEAAVEERAIESIVVADFDSGEKPNNLDGDFGAWDRDPEDKTQWASDQFSQDERLGDDGYAVKISYDVDSPNTAFNGFWMKLAALDLRGFENLTFYVKGDEKDGYTTRFKVELKNRSEASRYLVRGVTTSWTKVTIPLDKFKDISQWDKMDEFVIVFDDMNVTKKTGSIYIDEVEFEKAPTN